MGWASDLGEARGRPWLGRDPARWLAVLLELLEMISGTPIWNLFQYVTIRASLAAVFAFLVTVASGPAIIRYLRRRKIGEDVTKKDSGVLVTLHESKGGTPTMGGVLILIAVLASSLLFGRLRNSFVLLVMLGTTALGFVGFIDDWIKLSYKDRPGLRAASKLLLQFMVCGALAWAVTYVGSPPYEIQLPFVKGAALDLSPFHGVLYIVFATVLIVGFSNAVNLTDGLDGLATGCAIMAAVAFAIIVYIVGRVDYSEYLHLTHVRGASELTIICAALAGANMGFLWFNAHPAQVFMGDTGSLPIGGLLGLVAVIAKQEFVLLIVGGVFVMEAVSVVLQVGSFKLRGKRIFRIAPIHHHFQFAGWHEVKVVTRFWIIAAICAIAGLATLKVR